VTYGVTAWNSATAGAGPAAGDAFWMLTIYGREWLSIRDTRPVGPRVVGAAGYGASDSGYGGY
jgi:hypothetical protein